MITLTFEQIGKILEENKTEPHEINEINIKTIVQALDTDDLLRQDRLTALEKAEISAIKKALIKENSNHGSSCSDYREVWQREKHKPEKLPERKLESYQGVE